MKEFCYLCTAKSIISRVVKYAGYVYHKKKLAREYFWPHVEKHDGHQRYFIDSYEQVYRYFPIPSLEHKVFQEEVLRFTRYVHHYKILPWNILGRILKNKMETMGVSSMVIKEFYTF